jgi:outer membrane protein insertion porin family
VEQYIKEQKYRSLARLPFLIRLAWISTLFSAFCIAIGAGRVLAAEGPAVAVLPLKVHAADQPAQLGFDVQKMLAEMLARKGIQVIDPRQVNRHPLAGKPGVSRLEALDLANSFGAYAAIMGSLTQIAREISIDVEVIERGMEKEPKLFFMTADRMDLLRETVGRLANSVYLELSGVPQVDSVRVEGNRRIEDAAILLVAGIKAGDLVDQAQLDKDLRAIYQMGYFDDVKIRIEDGPKGKVVIFEVTEKPSVGRIVFSGNRKIKDDDLQKELGFSRYAVYDPNEVRQSVERLKELYRQKAFYNAEISVDVSELPNNEVQLEYRIQENQKVFITDISFKGNESFSDRRLKKVMMTSEKGFFSWITSSGHLDKRKIEIDLLKLSSFYHNHGYIKARVAEPEVIFREEKGINLLFEIEEGARYSVGQLAVAGDLDRAEEELLEKLELRSGDVFNREILREDVERIREVFVDQGYAYAEVAPLTREDEQEHTVDITFRITKGKKVKFERIMVSGNTVTRENVIRRELAAIEGDYFSGESFRKSAANLRRLDYFEDVEIQTRKGSSDEEIVLDIKVEERPTGVFAAGAGYSSEENAFVLFELGERNLFGKGYSLFANARIGGISSLYDIRFVNPWVYDTPISMGIDLYNWEREWDDYTRDSWGGAYTIGFPLAIDEYTRGSIKYGYDDANIYDVLDTAAWQIREMVGRNVTSSMTLELKRDSTDRSWNTTKGSLNSLTFEYAGGVFGGDEYFNKYEARSAWFFPVKWGTAIMLQGRVGYAERRSGGDLSVFQKYKLGGINTVRGFDYGTISPMEGGNYIGGEKMMVYNVEYSFPVVEEQGVSGVFFFDAGNVFTKDESFGFSGIRKSVGAGIRWYSPMGPLRLEYGRNLDPEEWESKGRWEFSIGGFL